MLCRYLGTILQRVKATLGSMELPLSRHNKSGMGSVPSSLAKMIDSSTQPNKLTAEQIETLQEAGLSTKQITALPNVYRLTSSQINLAVEIGAIPSFEGESGYREVGKLSDDEIDFSDIPQFDPDAWKDAVVIPAKKTKRLVSI